MQHRLPLGAITESAIRRFAPVLCGPLRQRASLHIGGPQSGATACVFCRNSFVVLHIKWPLDQISGSSEMIAFFQVYKRPTLTYARFRNVFTLAQDSSYSQTLRSVPRDQNSDTWSERPALADRLAAEGEGAHATQDRMIYNGDRELSAARTHPKGRENRPSPRQSSKCIFVPGVRS